MPTLRHIIAGGHDKAVPTDQSRSDDLHSRSYRKQEFFEARIAGSADNTANSHDIQIDPRFTADFESTGRNCYLTRNGCNKQSQKAAHQETSSSDIHILRPPFREDTYDNIGTLGTSSGNQYFDQQLFHAGNNNAHFIRCNTVPLQNHHLRQGKIAHHNFDTTAKFLNTGRQGHPKILNSSAITMLSAVGNPYFDHLVEERNLMVLLASQDLALPSKTSTTSRSATTIGSPRSGVNAFDTCVQNGNSVQNHDNNGLYCLPHHFKGLQHQHSLHRNQPLRDNSFTSDERLFYLAPHQEMSAAGYADSSAVGHKNEYAFGQRRRYYVLPAATGQPVGDEERLHLNNRMNHIDKRGNMSTTAQHDQEVVPRHSSNRRQFQRAEVSASEGDVCKKDELKRPQIISDDKPRRPLNAYNYFFSEEREIILAEFKFALQKAGTTAAELSVEQISDFLDSPPILPPELQKDVSNRVKTKSRQTLEIRKESERRKKPPHRKSHGLGFRSMSNAIAKRWKKLPKSSKRMAYFIGLAKEDEELYKKAMTKYYYPSKRSKSIQQKCN